MKIVILRYIRLKTKRTKHSGGDNNFYSVWLCLQVSGNCYAHYTVS